MTTIELAKALFHIAPSAEWVARADKIDADNYESAVEWLSQSTKPNWSDVEQGLIDAQAAVQAKKDEIVAARESAMTKLAELGLTVPEIKSIVS